MKIPNLVKNQNLFFFISGSNMVKILKTRLIFLYN